MRCDPSAKVKRESTPISRHCVSVKGVLGKTIRGKTPKTSAELATLILDEVEVAAVPGEAFGPSGYLRFSYALGDDDIVEGIGRVKKLLSEAI